MVVSFNEYGNLYVFVIILSISVVIFSIYDDPIWNLCRPFSRKPSRILEPLRCIFIADSVGLASVKFVVGCEICMCFETECKSSKVVDFGTKRGVGSKCGAGRDCRAAGLLQWHWYELGQSLHCEAATAVNRSRRSKRGSK